MRARKAFAVAGSALALALAWALFAGRPAAAAPPEPIRMSFGTIVPEGTPWAEDLRSIKMRVERESGGRIKVALFLGGRRGSENDMLTELRRGKLQGAGLSTGSVAAEVPELQCLEFPFLFRDTDEVDAILEGPIGKKLVEKAAERGIALPIWGENGWRSIGTRSKPVRTPDDVKDLRVRAQESQINVAFWQSLGALPTQIPLNEVLPALKTNVIDGFDQTPLYMSAAGWHTEIQHFTLTKHSYQGACVIYNKRFLDSLPEDLRTIVLADSEGLGSRNRQAVRAMTDELYKEFENARIKVYRLTDAEREAFRERTRVVYDRFKDTEVGALVAEIQRTLAERRAQEAPK